MRGVRSEPGALLFKTAVGGWKEVVPVNETTITDTGTYGVVQSTGYTVNGAVITTGTGSVSAEIGLEFDPDSSSILSDVIALDNNKLANFTITFKDSNGVYSDYSETYSGKFNKYQSGALYFGFISSDDDVYINVSELTSNVSLQYFLKYDSLEETWSVNLPSATYSMSQSDNVATITMNYDQVFVSITPYHYEDLYHSLDGRYLPVDGSTVTLNADGELEATASGGTSVDANPLENPTRTAPDELTSLKIDSTTYSILGAYKTTVNTAVFDDTAGIVNANYLDFYDNTYISYPST